jgi:hypothetical protein
MCPDMDISGIVYHSHADGLWVVFKNWALIKQSGYKYSCVIIYIDL